MSLERARLLGSGATGGVANAVGAGLLAAAVAGGLFAVGRGDARWAVATGAAVGLVVAGAIGLSAVADRIPWPSLRVLVALAALAAAVGCLAWAAGAASAGRLSPQHLQGALAGLVLLVVAGAASSGELRRVAVVGLVAGAAAAAVATTAWDDVPTLGGVLLTGPWPSVVAVLALAAVVAVADATIRSGATDVTQDTTSDALTPSDQAAQFRRRGIHGVYIGKDGRVSTSKLQVSLWTLTVLFILVHLFVQGRCLGSCTSADVAAFGEAALRDLQAAWTLGLRPEYWALLGFPAATAAYAKALTGRRAVHKAAITESEQKGGLGQGLREATMDDVGFVDIGDLQYVVFSLFAVAVVLLQFLTDPQSGFPEVPGTLLGLVGVSSAAYGVKKAVTTDVGPEIRTVLPSELIVGQDETLEIRGEGFLLPRQGAHAEEDGEEKVILAGRPLDPTLAWVRSVTFARTLATVAFEKDPARAQAFLRDAGISVDGPRLVTTVRVRDRRGIESPEQEIVLRTPDPG